MWYSGFGLPTKSSRDRGLPSRFPHHTDAKSHISDYQHGHAHDSEVEHGNRPAHGRQDHLSSNQRLQHGSIRGRGRSAAAQASRSIQDMHQPLVLTSMPPKMSHGPHSSPSAPWYSRQFAQMWPS